MKIAVLIFLKFHSGFVVFVAAWTLCKIVLLYTTLLCFPCLWETGFPASWFLLKNLIAQDLRRDACTNVEAEVPLRILLIYWVYAMTWPLPYPLPPSFSFTSNIIFFTELSLFVNQILKERLSKMISVGCKLIFHWSCVHLHLQNIDSNWWY